MNDNDIYELLSESFDDKIKPNFEDVKNRIAKLSEQENNAVIPSAPFKQSKMKIAFSIAAAACLVLVCGISSVMIAANSGKNESETAPEFSAATAEYDGINGDFDDAYTASEQNEAMKFGISRDETSENCDDCCAESIEVSDSDITTDSVSESDVQ